MIVNLRIQTDAEFSASKKWSNFGGHVFWNREFFLHEILPEVTRVVHQIYEICK